MAHTVKGNTRGLSPSQIRAIQRLYSRKIPENELVSRQVGIEVSQVAEQVGRKVGLLVDRSGRIEEVFVGSREILYLPDIGRYRLGKGRLRRLRLIYSELGAGSRVEFTSDIFADLEKLRLDAVVAVRQDGNALRVSYAHLHPLQHVEEAPVNVEYLSEIDQLALDFSEFIANLEQELSSEQIAAVAAGKTGAVIVGVYPKIRSDYKESIRELHELARTAKIEILGEIIQRRNPDPKTVLGKGKLEEVVLQCLRLGAEMIIFDSELKPFQWRVITNSTELKVIDRSMLILDIFAQRARSSAGRLQVELAQLKYNLPRLVEKDAGLSRLTGGIGGRGPGETKLEIGRRRSRDRIRMLEKRLEKLGRQRGLQQSTRSGRGVPLLAIVGYTNAGKSTLFNALTGGGVLVEDKLFATLDTTQRKFMLPHPVPDPDSGQILKSYGIETVLSDTVGFIRELPEELKAAFSATLDELYDASLLIHVLDSSDPNIENQFHQVNAILAEMNLRDLPRVVVLNKADLQDPFILEQQEDQFDAVSVSAENKEGLDELTSELIGQLYKLRPDLNPEFLEVSLER